MTRQTRAPSGDRWYVLAVLTAVYTLNIADRFSISTLIEPIRIELKLTDSGIGFLTGAVSNVSIWLLETFPSLQNIG